jgi:prepilin-type N-terminal cleavage/methylation domain-containing protein
MKRGFTLVEILVSSAVMAVIAGVIYAVLDIGNLSGRQDAGLIDLQQQARLCMDGMTREIRQNKAADITISDPGPASGAEITFKVPGSSYCYNYSLSNGRVIRRILNCADSAELAQAAIANDINSLEFSISVNLVEIRLSAAKTVNKRQLCFPAPCETPAKTLREKVRLRN